MKQITKRIYDDTNIYIKNVPKNVRKEMGQFFTHPVVASYMGSLAEIKSSSIRILDAGAGNGILIGSICENILKNNNEVCKITVDLYENNDTIISLLSFNMELLRTELSLVNIEFQYSIIEENFILYNEKSWLNNDFIGIYDIVISNPPYKKIGKLDAESVVMNSIIHGQPNIYFLFIAMATKLLKNDGQLIFITPRSFTSGAYFRKFREWFLNNIRLYNIHIFISRSDVFSCDNILQETIIFKAIKTKEHLETVTISETPSLSDFSNIVKHKVSYNLIANPKDEHSYIKIPSSIENVELLTIMNDWKENLITLGFKLKTGPIVDFRSTKYLVDTEEYDGENTVPVFWSSNFSESNLISHPVRKKQGEYQVAHRCPKSDSILLKNKDYIFIKRFTTKEEHRRLQCALYFANKFNTQMIGIENHLNYITKIKGEITKDEIYGIFTILNSTYADKYYRILNGSTQVNATEVNSMPFPSLDVIVAIGKRALLINDNLTCDSCDEIINEEIVLNREYKRAV